MKICPKCNKEYEDKFTFCYDCGSKLQTKDGLSYCSCCGQLIDDDSDFCPFCGRKINADGFQKNGVYQMENNVILDNNSMGKTGFSCSVSDSKEPFFSKHHLFSYEGRRGRSSYFNVLLFWRLILFVPDKILDVMSDKVDDVGSFIFFFGLLLVLSYPSFCNIAKRLHDLNVSTKGAICYFVFTEILFMVLEITKALGDKSVSIIIALILMAVAVPLLFVKGTVGSNQYGDDPLL